MFIVKISRRLQIQGAAVAVAGKLLLFMALLTASTAPVYAASRKHAVQPEPPLQADYIPALAAADRFLHAWQIGDIEHGIIQLSDGVRRSQDAKKVEQFFINPKDRAFEIARGHGQLGRYSFPVVLVGTDGAQVTRKVSELIVQETGKNDWVVDKLP